MYKINEYVVYKREVCVVKDFKKINNQDYYTLENKEENNESEFGEIASSILIEKKSKFISYLFSI